MTFSRSRLRKIPIEKKQPRRGMTALGRIRGALRVNIGDIADYIGDTEDNAGSETEAD